MREPALVHFAPPRRSQDDPPPPPPAQLGAGSPAPRPRLGRAAHHPPPPRGCQRAPRDSPSPKLRRTGRRHTRAQRDPAARPLDAPHRGQCHPPRRPPHRGPDTAMAGRRWPRLSRSPPPQPEPWQRPKWPQRSTMTAGAAEASIPAPLNSQTCASTHMYAPRSASPVELVATTRRGLIGSRVSPKNTASPGCVPAS